MILQIGIQIEFSGDVSTFAGSGTAGCQDGIASAAQFKNAYNITFERSEGFFYVVDGGNNRICKISAEGRIYKLFCELISI